MKKVLALVLVTALALALVACGQAGGANKLGFASITSTGKSADLADKEGVKSALAQADTVYCAVMVDASGKVVDIKIDTVQAKVTFDEAGKITSNKAEEVKTKRELGDGYGMKKASPIGREWYEQADAIQKWMIGKTADQIKNMKTTKTDHGIVSAEPDLVSSATITVDTYIAVAVKAIGNAK